MFHHSSLIDSKKNKKDFLTSSQKNDCIYTKQKNEITREKSNCLEVFCRKKVFNVFAELIRKTLCQILLKVVNPDIYKEENPENVQPANFVKVLITYIL